MDDLSTALEQISLQDGPPVLTFDPEEHRYYLNGVKVKWSVTELRDQYFNKFDPVFAATLMLNSRKFPMKEKHLVYHPLTLWLDNGKLSPYRPGLPLRPLEEIIPIITEMWEANNKRAADEGTKFHKMVEDYVLHGIPLHDSVESRYFMEYLDGCLLKNWRIKSIEQRLCVISWDLAGSTDLIWETPEGDVLVDWKRSPIKEESTAYPNYGIGPCQYLEDTKMNKYFIQQGLYARMLKELGEPVVRAELVFIHPNNPSYLVVPVDLDVMDVFVDGIVKDLIKGLPEKSVS